ncbi:MAG: hypothetical protein H7835_00245 [Magnetococcus sp. XQGC-1]
MARFLLAICAVFFVSLPLWGEGESRVAPAAYRDCLLQKVQPAQSGLAASHLQQACRRKFAPDMEKTVEKSTTRSGGVQEMQPTEQENNGPVDDCLLNYLPTVHNDQSAQAMLQLCREQFGAPTLPTAADKRPSRLWRLLGIIPDKPQGERPDLTIDGEGFVPLVPWQAGQPR